MDYTPGLARHLLLLCLGRYGEALTPFWTDFSLDYLFAIRAQAEVPSKRHRPCDA